VIAGTSDRVLALPMLCAALLAAGCGAKRFAPPAGPGTPFPAYGAAIDEATTQCRGVKTMSATLALSGRAGEQRLRGRVDAGFAAPADVRLEGRAPFGRPVFILVARDTEHATLVLPRDNRVLRDAPPAAIVESLAGIALDPADLRSALAGCGFGGAATAGQSYNDLLAVQADDATHYLRRADGRWRLMASARGGLLVEYRDFVSGRPSTIRLRTVGAAPAGPQTDLSLKLSDVNINVPLEGAVFQVDVPAGAAPLTLDELRRAGPLGAGR
jgi:hypothetical protein